MPYDERLLTVFHATMLKWLLTLIVLLVVLGFAQPLLRRLGLGRLPGDVEVKRGRERYYFPIASTVVLSLLLTLLMLWLT
ncbi:MAG TPA: DUF2905 family protein [Pelomicrobium sp.]|nr:DUF2905 family protein [Pelomicrobium sp.]